MLVERSSLLLRVLGEDFSSFFWPPSSKLRHLLESCLGLRLGSLVLKFPVKHVLVSLKSTHSDGSHLKEDVMAPTSICAGRRGEG